MYFFIQTASGSKKVLEKPNSLSIPLILFRNVPQTSFWILLCLAAFILPGDLWAEHNGRSVKLHCPNEQLLHEFNERFELGSSCSLKASKDIKAVENEVLAKIDTVIEKAKTILNIYPKYLQVNLVILPTSNDCSTVFSQKYGERKNQIAFYSLSENTIYISAEDTRLGVIAHELAHAIVDFYFSGQLPYHVQELMAQSVETHIHDSEDLIEKYRLIDKNAAKIRRVCTSYMPRDE